MARGRDDRQSSRNEGFQFRSRTYPNMNRSGHFVGFAQQQQSNSIPLLSSSPVKSNGSQHRIENVPSKHMCSNSSPIGGIIGLDDSETIKTSNAFLLDNSGDSGIAGVAKSPSLIQSSGTCKSPIVSNEQRTKEWSPQHVSLMNVPSCSPISQQLSSGDSTQKSQPQQQSQCNGPSIITLNPEALSFNSNTNVIQGDPSLSMTMVPAAYCANQPTYMMPNGGGDLAYGQLMQMPYMAQFPPMNNNNNNNNNCSHEMIPVGPFYSNDHHQNGHPIYGHSMVNPFQSAPMFNTYGVQYGQSRPLNTMVQMVETNSGYVHYYHYDSSMSQFAMPIGATFMDTSSINQPMNSFSMVRHEHATRPFTMNTAVQQHPYVYQQQCPPINNNYNYNRSMRNNGRFNGRRHMGRSMNRLNNGNIHNSQQHLPNNQLVNSDKLITK